MTQWRAFKGHFGKWEPTIAQVRDILLAGAITGCLDLSEQVPMRPEAWQYRSTPEEVDRVGDYCTDAVRAGRLIDFGWLSNNVIIFGGTRGGRLWDAGGLSMPFSEPWVFRHAWEGGVSVYLVNPIANGDGGLLPDPRTGELLQTGEGFECAEMAAYQIEHRKMLVIQDRGRIFKPAPGMAATKFWGAIAPSFNRFFADPELFRRCNNYQEPGESAGANLADPVGTALLMLGTRNVERETVRAPDKLQRARMKSGKPPIPPHDVVHSEPYVTAVESRGARRDHVDDQGGTHRSPVAHIRMGHPREYASGRTIFIKDTLVNVPADQRDAFKAQRSHYDAGRLNRVGL